MSRRIARRAALPLFALAILTACGKPSADIPLAASTPTPALTASPLATLKPAAPAKPRKSAAPTVAPEVIVPSTTDVRARQSFVGWQGLVMDGLRRVDPRLVTTEAQTLKKVRVTCQQVSTGMFETKVVPIIMARFSNAKVTVSHDMAEDIYSVLLEDACYKMAEAPSESPTPPAN
jgi:hypothetical protein